MSIKDNVHRLFHHSNGRCHCLKVTMGGTGCLSASAGSEAEMPDMPAEQGHRKRVRHYDESGHFH